MATEDWAIVVGISAYPGISEAVGAEADARAFRDWLIDPAGGDVPQDQVELIVTSEYGPPWERPEPAKPTFLELWAAGEKLLRRGEGTGCVGRRLYLYFAGHGIAAKETETALLMANAHKRAMGAPLHWLGEYTAEHFRQSSYFDEILLFMDCCREIVAVEGLTMPWAPLRAAGFAERVKRFYAYATRWSGLAWARPMAAGGAGGEFTAALLEGLKHSAYEPNSDGKITTGSLKKYLLDKLPTLQDSDFRADDFVVAKVQTIEYPIVIHLPDRTAGLQAQIRVARDGRFQVLHQTIAAPPTWELTLDKGLYEVQILQAGLQEPFDVDGTGGRDVKLE
jgi:hypothetical protein